MKTLQMPFALVIWFLLGILNTSDATWCVCNPSQPQSSQQTTLDYACGAGANCNPILQNGACYNPNNVNSHCSYAANSYFQKNNQAQSACVFAGTTTITQQDPSPGSGCVFPATPSAAATSGGTAPVGTGMGTGTPSPGTFSPGGVTSSPPGATTGVLPGLGPAGTGISTTDGSGAGSRLAVGFPAKILDVLLPFLVVFITIFLF